MPATLPQSYPAFYNQPLKAIYIVAHILALGGVVPVWLLRYSLFQRPRPAWTLKESILVRLIRWMMMLNGRTGISPLATDKTREVPQAELEETSFVWIEPVSNEHLKGHAVDETVPVVRVPGYTWPKGGDLGKSDETALVGLFFHGGGYIMGNGSESFPECDIARQISKRTRIKNILSVDYRLAPEAPHPAQLIDALSGYSYLVNTLSIPPSRIVIIGACAGGHLALMLTRYLFDEKILPLPTGLMLFSPMVDLTIDADSYLDPSEIRPNTDIDLLSTSYYVNMRFLGGSPPNTLSTPLLSGNLAPPGSYVNYPPTFISVGDCEAFQRECEQLTDKMAADGVDITLDVQQDAVHDFLGFGAGIPCDKAREAVLQRVFEWVEALERGQ